jgi:hypothetical protein
MSSAEQVCLVPGDAAPWPDTSSQEIKLSRLEQLLKKEKKKKKERKKKHCYS